MNNKHRIRGILFALLGTILCYIVRWSGITLTELWETIFAAAGILLIVIGLLDLMSWCIGEK